jgi:2-dehydropantoate 2-reductase
VEAIQSGGLTVEYGGSRRKVGLKATLDPDAAAGAQLVLIFVKSTQTAAAAATAASLAGKSGCVLTLQNGMGNAETLAEAVPADRVVVGTTSHGATLLGPGRIRHAGKGPTTIGPWSAEPKAGQRAQKVAETLTGAAIDAEVVEKVLPILWNKLIVNVGINAITALTGIQNGQLLDLDITRDLSRSAVAEAVSTARAKDIAVREEAVSHVFDVAAATAANRSSMGQDIDNKRLTEIDAINGYVVREARRAGVAAPVNQTLTALVKTLEAHY